ncbi:hypothetical protein AVEN_196067-1 [Araneus ventricosus]|uniref:Uncharacterized protein n=1 Tax=Araneus ventricosus TaxID=182803 RepID=A0A4Y2NS77_ARAVE|nr:hypothetical protein AVEN_196067-1 [Araneus ventricosus]
MSTPGKVLVHDPNFYTAEIPSTNELTEFLDERTIFEEKPDWQIETNFKNSEEQVMFENEQVSSDQTAVLEECYDNAEIGISKQEISATKKK